MIPRGRIEPNTTEAAEFHKSICPPTQPVVLFSGGTNTPDSVTADTVFQRKVFRELGLPLPYPNPTTGQNFIEMWVIEAGDLVTFPSPPIRVGYGEIVHVITETRSGHHTIHHHGIEPTPMNDGVGHTSFDIQNGYTYQWQANSPGTYFYHCHHNTVLHVEMGMYGALIVDPPQGPNFVAGFNPSGGHAIPFDVEAFWVVDEMDSRWHNDLNHAAFMAACADPIDPLLRSDPNNPATFTSDGFFNEFRPDVFAITGAVRANDSTPITDPRAAITARVGQTILIRLLNAGYTVQRYTLGLDALVIAADGRPFGVPPFGSYSQPFTVRAGTPFRLTSARRWDLILRPTQTGVFPATFEFRDWITDFRYATARTTITVNP